MKTIGPVPYPHSSSSGTRYPGVTGVVLTLILAWLAIASVPSFGQAVYGSIFGTVTDNTGAVVPNVTVTVTDTNKGTSVTTQTDSSGAYRVQHMIPDTYTVSVEATGFSKSTAENVIVYADTSPKVDIKLTVGSVSNTVTVSSGAPLLEADRAEVSTILNARAVENLPNLNRNFTAFELLTPGTTYIGWGTGDAANPQRSQAIEVNGQLPFATGYELDGTDNQDPVIGVEVINPNLDAVSEMKVTSQNYDPEFGKAVAGLVTGQTKSGSNDLHGTAFEYRRSDAQQARNPFSNQFPDSVTHKFLAPTLHNQFGGSIGGPIRKEKLFFFGDYQGQREKTGSSTLTTVPTALAHSTCTSGGDCNLSEYLTGLGLQIYDPASNQTSTSGRTPIVGNIIPAGRLATAAVNLFKNMPLPNTPGNSNGTVNNYSASGSGKFNTNQFDVRVDGQTGEKLHLFGRYTYLGSTQGGAPYFGAAGGPGFDGGFSGTVSGLNHSVAAGMDYVVTPKWLTDVRVGYYRIHLAQFGPNYTLPLGNQLGIPNTNSGNLSLNGGLPLFQIDAPSATGANGGGTLSYGTTTNQFLQNSSQYQIVNNWAHQMGAHNIKFGVDLRYGLNHVVGLDNNNLRSGNYIFSATRTAGSDASGTGVSSPGLGYASFLLGDVTSFTRTQTQNTNAQERQKRFFTYGQDQWRITTKLTLNYGLRWELYFPETVNGKGQGGLLDLNTGNIRIAGYGPWGTNLNVAKNWTTFAPRVGLAYQMFPKTVVRAGFGTVYGQGWSGNTYGEVLTFSYPTQVSQNIPSVTNAASAFNLNVGPPSYTFASIPSSGNYPLPDGVSVPTRPLKMRFPTLEAWNMAVQQELSSSMSLQISYVGSEGYHNMFDSSNQYDPNQQTIAGFDQINPATGMTYTTNDRRPYYNGVAQTLGVKYGVPHGWTQGLRYNNNQATSSYNALQVVLNKRFSQGLQFLTHYTWSKAMSHESYYFLIDPRVGRGRSYYNRDQAFVLAGSYDLPFGKNQMFGGNASGWMNQTIGGWQINGTLLYQSGLPYTPGYQNCGQDQDLGICFLNKTGAAFKTKAGSYDPINNRVPFFTASPNPLTPAGTAGSTFGPYARPAKGTFGNVGRDTLTGPNLFNTDMSVMKNFTLRESLHLQLQAQAFNVFNHVNLGGPNNCVDCGGNSGYITGLIGNPDGEGTPMRRLQFAARFQF